MLNKKYIPLKGIPPLRNPPNPSVFNNQNIKNFNPEFQNQIPNYNRNSNRSEYLSNFIISTQESIRKCYNSFITYCKKSSKNTSSTDLQEPIISEIQK
jgi:hypothetical protein